MFCCGCVANSVDPGVDTSVEAATKYPGAELEEEDLGKELPNSPASDGRSTAATTPAGEEQVATSLAEERGKEEERAEKRPKKEETRREEPSCPAAEGGNAQVRALEADVTRLVEENSPPEDKARSAALGWKDISKPTASVFFKKANATCDNVFMNMNSADQVRKFPLLEMQGDKIICGVIPTTYVVEYWHLWFPFCQTSEVLKRFSPTQFIARVELKVMMFCVDFIVYISVSDQLQSNGCVRALMRSPPSGSEGQEWMGITVPPKPGMLPRLCVNYCMAQFTPITSDSMRLQCTFEYEDPIAAPYWVKSFVFQQLAVRILPELEKFQKKIPGSALDRHINAKDGTGMDADQKAFILGIEREITALLQRKAACSS